MIALLPTRPTLRVLLGQPLVAGSTVTLAVELTCARALTVARARVSLVGEVSWTYSGHYRGHRQHATFVRGVETLVDRAQHLDAGVHRLPLVFTLPDDIPGTWEGHCLSVEYRVIVELGIPWWFGVHREFAVPVSARARERGEPPARARVWASHPLGPVASQPYVEVALAGTTLRAGGELRGSAALGNVARHRYRRLVVQLVARETLPSVLQLAPSEERATCSWTFALDELDELAPLPFTLRLPDRLVPGFEVQDCRLHWLLVVSAEPARGTAVELRVPVEVSPAAASSSGPTTPLSVGAERIALIWQEVADRCGLEVLSERMVGTLGEGAGRVAFELRRTLGPRGEPRLSATLRMPSLGLGLVSKGERRGVQLRTREPATLQMLERELGNLGALELVDASDSALAFARDDAGLHLAGLLDWVTGLCALGRRLAELPARLPAPLAMQPYLARWEAAALTLAGRLRRGDMRIEIVRATLRVTIGCVFEEGLAEPSGTLLELEANLAIPTRLQRNWTGHGQAPAHPWPLAELVANPGQRPARLSIGERSVQVLLPAPLPDPALEHERIELLFACGRALHGETNPYR
jgi:hypothetical protein